MRMPWNYRSAGIDDDIIRTVTVYISCNLRQSDTVAYDIDGGRPSGFQRKTRHFAHIQ